MHLYSQILQIGKGGEMRTCRLSLAVFLCCGLGIGVGLVGCGDDDDDGGGGCVSTLEVSNSCAVCVDLYVDQDLKGEVCGGETEQFAVSCGVKELEYCVGINCESEGTRQFEEGRTIFWNLSCP